MEMMKTTLLALAVLGTPLLVHVASPPTNGFCSNASGTAQAVINIILLAFGLPPIC
jgi:hypothetical protein